MVNCVSDDLAQCCGKCGELKIVVPIPVSGRLPLLKHTIERLYNRNKVHKVICVGETLKERRVCEQAGAEFIVHSNRYLGAKWNAGFMAAKKYNPDACMFVGSSDWLSDNWIPFLGKYLGEFDLIGLPGCYFVDISKAHGLRACHWPGYIGEREGESIGIGRIISAKMLEKLDWKPFEDHLKHSLDYSMINRVTKKGGNIRLLKYDGVKSLSVSTDQWRNKHQFEDHYSNKLPSKRLINVDSWVEENFPEIKLIFNDHPIAHK